jgi:hypothetical protein
MTSSRQLMTQPGRSCREATDLQIGNIFSVVQFFAERPQG